LPRNNLLLKLLGYATRKRVLQTLALPLGDVAAQRKSYAIQVDLSIKIIFAG
jgi:hypothetical protein